MFVRRRINYNNFYKPREDNSFMEAEEVEGIRKKWDQAGGLEGSSYDYRSLDLYFKNLLIGDANALKNALENLLNPKGIIQSGDNREPGTIRKVDYEQCVGKIDSEFGELYKLIHKALEEKSEILYKKRDKTLRRS